MKGLVFLIISSLLGLSTYANEAKMLEEKLKEDPQNLSAIHELAKIYHDRALHKEEGALKCAERFLKEAQKKFPNDMVIFAWYGSLLTIKARDSWFPPLKLSRLRKGISILDEAVERAGDNITVRMIRANNSLYLPEFIGRVDVAIEDFKYLLKRSEEDDFPKELLPKIHLGIAKAYIKKEKFTKAKAHLRKVFELADKSSKAYKEAESIMEEIRN
jgi:tetratricopeptide (TPR) repeat protein